VSGSGDKGQPNTDLDPVKINRFNLHWIYMCAIFKTMATSKTKPRPEGTRPLFVNAPEELLEALDEMAEEVRRNDPMKRRVTRTDLVLKAVADMVERWRAKRK
jgi:hypothetical protein